MYSQSSETIQSREGERPGTICSQTHVCQCPLWENESDLAEDNVQRDRLLSERLPFTTTAAVQ